MLLIKGIKANKDKGSNITRALPRRYLKIQFHQFIKINSRTTTAATDGTGDQEANTGPLIRYAAPTRFRCGGCRKDNKRRATISNYRKLQKLEEKVKVLSGGKHI